MTHGDNRKATGNADAGHSADNKGNESMKAEDLGPAGATNGKSKMEPDKTIGLDR
jgi:hypothetical protein